MTAVAVEKEKGRRRRELVGGGNNEVSELRSKSKGASFALGPFPL